MQGGREIVPVIERKTLSEQCLKVRAFQSSFNIKVNAIWGTLYSIQKSMVKGQQVDFETLNQLAQTCQEILGQLHRGYDMVLKMQEYQERDGLLQVSKSMKLKEEIRDFVFYCCEQTQNLANNLLKDQDTLDFLTRAICYHYLGDSFRIRSDYVSGLQFFRLSNQAQLYYEKEMKLVELLPQWNPLRISVINNYCMVLYYSEQSTDRAMSTALGVLERSEDFRSMVPTQLSAQFQSTIRSLANNYMIWKSECQA